MTLPQRERLQVSDILSRAPRLSSSLAVPSHMRPLRCPGACPRRFLFEGQRVCAQHTPAELDMMVRSPLVAVHIQQYSACQWCHSMVPKHGMHACGRRCCCEASTWRCVSCCCNAQDGDTNDAVLEQLGGGCSSARSRAAGSRRAS